MALFKRGGTFTSYVWMAGVRHSKALHTGNRRMAEQLDRQHKEGLLMRQYQAPKLNPEMEFGELVATFIAEGMAKPYTCDRLKHLLPFFEHVPLHRIDKAAVRRYRQQRHAASELKVATVNRDVSVLRRLLYWAVEEGYLVANPLARLRMERERRTKRPILSVREELELLPAASAHLYGIVLCALDTGMRRGEILGQMWEDIDFDNGLLYVSTSKTPEGEAREIPLTERLASWLYPKRKANGPAFTFGGEALREIKRTWQATLRRAKLRHFRFHDLRHTANTRLRLAGVMQEVRRELMGHTLRDSRDVNDTYGVIGLPEKYDAIRKLEVWHIAQVHRLAQPTAPVDPQETLPAAQP